MNTSKKSILIVDPDTNTRQILAERLTYLNYDVFLSTDGVEALKIINSEDINLIILDILLPKIDGFEVCRQIRKNSYVPIIILTAINHFDSRIIGLESGADDFIAKPFSLKEVEIRISYNLRRPNLQKFELLPARQEIFYFGSLTINFNKQKVFKNNKQLLLTGVEYKILYLLIKNSGRQLSRKILLDNIWGYTPERDIDTRIVDVHIHRLRSKLEKNPKNPDFIVTVRGVGYMFQTLNL